MQVLDAKISKVKKNVVPKIIELVTFRDQMLICGQIVAILREIISRLAEMMFNHWGI